MPGEGQQPNSDRHCRRAKVWGGCVLRGGGRGGGVVGGGGAEWMMSMFFHVSSF